MLSSRQRSPCSVSCAPLQQRRLAATCVGASGCGSSVAAAACSGGGRCDGGCTTCVKQRASVLACWLCSSCRARCRWCVCSGQPQRLGQRVGDAGGWVAAAVVPLCAACTRRWCARAVVLFLPVCGGRVCTQTSHVHAVCSSGLPWRRHRLVVPGSVSVSWQHRNGGHQQLALYGSRLCSLNAPCLSAP